MTRPPRLQPGSSVFVRKDAPVNIPRFETPPVIDGEIKDEVWRNGALFGDFYQTQPGDNVKPSHPTEVMMGYDAKNLYIAFQSYPGPQHRAGDGGAPR